jgi:hypothetical protein
VCNFAQTPSGRRAHPSRIKPPFQGDSAPKHVGATGSASCTIRDATALSLESVCWRLENASLVTANSISLWPPHGSRSPIRMRRWMVGLRSGARPARRTPSNTLFEQGLCDFCQGCRVRDMSKAVSLLGESDSCLARLAGDILVSVQHDLRRKGRER